ncbi:sugar transferase [Nodosilinea sp. PGN35]|uniref:sugar transferase n=1 Tax=Nodosilinea sp. PGN35 TaxID=3020489 RepID=UPI0023B3218A|nr:sugar transferase [Nodosilinea sp. TSF1-S3]MDF0367025.1 sugar transferase [Nodosilinea sp. TSF1-S3]
MLKSHGALAGSRALLYHRSVYSSAKRGLDILGSLAGLVVLAIAVVPVAIAIYLDNPGPIFFSQVRCGLGGKRFRLYKFRSMVVGAEALKHLVENESSGHIFKNANDPRITRVGRFLRSTSLDELPQFWNVLRGDMSLVGTRPPTPDEVQHYSDRHWQRLHVKPGMTGEWQVSGRSNVRDFEAIIDLDLRYQVVWTVWYDVLILLRTVRVLLRRSGSF